MPQGVRHSGLVGESRRQRTGRSLVKRFIINITDEDGTLIEQVTVRADSAEAALTSAASYVTHVGWPSDELGGA